MILEKQIVATADVANKNGRIYPRSLLERLVEEHKDKIGGFGTVGSTIEIIDNLNPSAFQQSSIDLTKVAFTWANLRLEGDNLLADVKILNTPKGKLLMTLLMAMDLDQIVFRTMGIATGCIDGIVGDDYKLIGLKALTKDLAA